MAICLLSVPFHADAQQAPAARTSTDDALKAFRNDLQGAPPTSWQRTDLTADQAAKFWPAYAKFRPNSQPSSMKKAMSS
jgi:hypothetical protein